MNDSLDPLQKAAAIQLFELKRAMRKRIEEYETLANAAKQPQTKRWYRFLALEIENLLRESIQLEKKFPPLA
jgi:hypothetical protein